MSFDCFYLFLFIDEVIPFNLFSPLDAKENQLTISLFIPCFVLYLPIFPFTNLNFLPFFLFFIALLALFLPLAFLLFLSLIIFFFPMFLFFLLPFSSLPSFPSFSLSLFFFSLLFFFFIFLMVFVTFFGIFLPSFSSFLNPDFTLVPFLFFFLSSPVLSLLFPSFNSFSLFSHPYP